VQSSCLGISLPIETEVAILGAYEGGIRLNGRGRQPGDHSPGAVMVKSSSVGSPQVLVLTAYEPVIWDLSGVSPHRLRGVVAYGHYQPQVVNVPANLPVRTAAYTNRDPQNRCGERYSVHEGGPELEALANQLERGLGLRPTRFKGEYNPTVLNLDGWEIGDVKKLLQRNYNSSVATGIYPSNGAMQTLLEMGVVRPATEADIDGWNRQATANLSTANIAAYKSEYLRLGSTYVVLAPFTMPDGMHGAHSRDFIVPTGIAQPYDRGSHNSYYFMQSGTCFGTAPDCQHTRPMGR
jgi:hypothetical protein